MERYTFKYDYELYKDYKNAFDYQVVKELWTDYFDVYDYVLGDMSYGKLRLKGFYSNDNKKVKKYNNIDKAEEYISIHCAYGCGYFILKKVK